MSVDVARPSLSRPRTREENVLLGLLVAMAVWMLVMQVAVMRSFFPPIGIISAVWLAVPAALVAKGVRAAPLVAVVMTGLMLVANVPYLIKDLGDPGWTMIFAWNVIALPLAVAGLVAAIRLLVQRRRAAGATATPPAR